MEMRIVVIRVVCSIKQNERQSKAQIHSFIFIYSGGFYVLFGSAWLQYGIVSAMRSNAAGYVDSNSIVVYTNVLKFKYWIVDIVAKSGVTVGEANTNVETKINLECEFAYGTDNKYVVNH